MLPNKDEEDETEKGFFLSKEFFITIGLFIFMGAFLVYFIIFVLPSDYKTQKTQECLELYKHDIYYRGCDYLVSEYLKKFE